MRNILLWLALALSLGTPTTLAQNKSIVPLSKSVATQSDASPLVGKWTYRSYHNTAELVDDDAAKALKLIFGEGVFTFGTSSTKLKGTFDMGGGYVLDLQGTIRPATREAPLTVQINGYGRPGSATDGWEYDYYAFMAYNWPNGINQVSSLVGTVVRAKPHGSAPAGYVASFIAVRQP
jgi:hypothetical protein